MQSTRPLIVALSLFAALASVANAEVISPISLNGGVGSRSSTSVLSIELAPSYNWTLDLSTMAAAGLTGNLFGMPTPLPLYGTNPAMLIMAGNYTGIAPANLISRNFTFTDLGGFSPAYNFTVSLDLLADRTIRTTVNVLGVGSFMPGGIIPQNPIMVPVTSVNVSGTATIAAVPAPGAVALAGMGVLFAFRRNRRPVVA